MKRKEQDALIRSAFGESGGQDLSMLESALQSEEGKRQYQQLEWMKQDLKSLADVPECQISNERLKDSILSAGSSRSLIGILVWQPIAALASILALALFSLNMTGSPTQNDAKSQSLAMMSTPSELVESADASDSSSALARKGSQLLARVNEKAVSPNDQLREEITASSTNASRRYSRKESKAPSAESSSPSAAAMMATATDDSATSARQPTRNALSNDLSKPVADTIVVVEPTTDPATRASEAQEVEKRDVVFGG